jgi:hypothetical protein
MNKRSFLRSLFALPFVGLVPEVKAKTPLDDLSVLQEFFGMAAAPTSHWRFKDSNSYTYEFDYLLDTTGVTHIWSEGKLVDSYELVRPYKEILT